MVGEGFAKRPFKITLIKGYIKFRRESVSPPLAAAAPVAGAAGAPASAKFVVLPRSAMMELTRCSKLLRENREIVIIKRSALPQLYWTKAACTRARRRFYSHLDIRMMSL